LSTPAVSRELLFVIGMHRSGTSALCAALAACGAAFGDQLLDPLAGVNDEGFWEHAGVVAINEQLLARTGSTWYAPAPGLLDTDWTADPFAADRQAATGLLHEVMAQGSLPAVKDPRLCLTLPFWLDLCQGLGIEPRICVINRAPLEVAHSLARRDGFPPGYGLRLYAGYRAAIARVVPPDAVYLRYDELLRDAPAVMTRLAAGLPLQPGGAELATAVRPELRHQRENAGEDLLARADAGEVDLQALAAAIEANYPVDHTLREFARGFAQRGLELAQIGEEHARALATLDQRDADIEALSAEHRRALATLDQRDADIEGLAAEHRQALATIDERDEQIREFDRRLSTLGAEHANALQTLRERDAELAWIKQRLDAISRIPGAGYLIRRLRKHAQG